MADTHTGELAQKTALLLCDDQFTRGDGVCTDLLTRGDNTVWVSFTRSPDQCLAQLPDAAAETTTVISVGTQTRSASESSRPSGPVDVVGDPSDLTGLGIAIDRALASEETTICFDSVTTLLQYVDIERAYEFLNSLVGRCWRSGVQAHFHLDPQAHEPETVALVTSLFDARIDTDGDDVHVTRPTLPDA